MRASTHLCFDGQCEAAFRTYERVLGGKVVAMLAYGDSPMADQVPPEWRDRIVHATLMLDGATLCGADVVPKDYERPQGFFVLLGAGEPAEARRLFDALADGGEVRLPFGETFWSAGFGAVIDRFGTPWEIDCERPLGG